MTNEGSRPAKARAVYAATQLISTYIARSALFLVATVIAGTGAVRAAHFVLLLLPRTLTGTPCCVICPYVPVVHTNMAPARGLTWMAAAVVIALLTSLRVRRGCNGDRQKRTGQK